MKTLKELIDKGYTSLDGEFMVKGTNDKIKVYLMLDKDIGSKYFSGNRSIWENHYKHLKNVRNQFYISERRLKKDE